MDAVTLPDGLTRHLGVRHTLKHTVLGGLHPSEIHYDEYAPMCHVFDALASEPVAEDDEWCVPEAPVARVLVNEFPRAIMRLHSSADSWGWYFDAANSGPTDILGTMINDLIRRRVLADSQNGAVLHVQNLEVLPDSRRLGIGSALVRFALMALSRTSSDVAVTELQPVRGVEPPLLPQAEREWSDDIALHNFLEKLGFDRWCGSGVSDISVLPDAGKPGTPVFFLRPGKFRRRWLSPVHSRRFRGTEPSIRIDATGASVPPR